MAVNTTGIQTNVNCANPNDLSATSTGANSSTVSATSVDGCSLQLTFNPANAEQQYGVVNVPNCGVGNTTSVALQPVSQTSGFSTFYDEVFIASLGLLMVLAAKSEQLGRCFLPTTDTVVRRDRLRAP
jgi:hypothetical protein